MPADVALETDRAAPSNVANSPSADYRPHLDGIRAIAVYLVVLFHAGSRRFTGGYVGVDVFFVLSGFLVTQVLLRDIDTYGSVRLPRFYGRRFRRLLPAAFVALVVTASVYVAISSPSEVAAALGGFKAVPSRIHIGMGLSLLTLLWGALVVDPAWRKIARTIQARGDLGQAAVLSRRFAVRMGIEHLFRLSVIVLMAWKA